MYQYLEIFNLGSIPMYNFLIGIGTILAFIFLDREISKSTISFKVHNKIYYSLIIALLACFAGAKIFEMVYHNTPFTLDNFMSGGFTFLGGLITGVVFYISAALLFGIKLNIAVNIAVPYLALAHAFGRIGCFLGGCCYGRPTDSFLGVMFPQGSLPAQHFGSHTHLHPTQLYESVGVFIIFFCLIRLVKFNYRIWFYLISYGTIRFVVEIFRADDRGSIITDVISPSQIISLVFITIGVIAFMFEKRRVTSVVE